MSHKSHKSNENVRNTWTHPSISIDNDGMTGVTIPPRKLSSYSTPQVDIVYSWDNVNVWTGPKRNRFFCFGKSAKTDEASITPTGAGDTVIDVKSGKQLLKNGETHLIISAGKFRL